jgi:hypothetical protein
MKHKVGPGGGGIVIRHREPVVITRHVRAPVTVPLTPDVVRQLEEQGSDPELIELARRQLKN